MLMALQHAHIAFISRCVIIVGEGLFRLGVLSSVPPLPLAIYDKPLAMGGLNT
jgi:hypothetical protein